MAFSFQQCKTLKNKISGLILLLLLCSFCFAQVDLEEQLNDQIDQLYDDSQYEACVPLYQKLQQFYAKEEEWEEQMRMYIYSGVCLSKAGQDLEMGTYLDSALLIAKNRSISEESSVFATYYSYASDYYQKIRNDKKAYEALVKILSIDKAAFGKDSANFTIDYLASDYNNLGLYYKTKGDYEEARIYYKQALSFYSKENIESKVKTYNNIAETYKAEEAIEKALITYREALKLAVSEESLTLVYNNLADTYSTIQPDSALHFLQLLKPLLSQNTKIDRANYHQILADTKRYEKAYEAAEENMLTALQLRKMVFKHNHPTIALAYRNLGMLYAQQNQHEKALKKYQLALANITSKFDATIAYTNNPSLEKQINDRLELLSIFKTKTQSLRAVNQFKAAKFTLQLAIQLIDQIRYNYLAEGSKYALLERAMPIYEQAIDLALEMDENEWAFEIAERSKATLLLESIKNSEAQTFAGISEELLEHEREQKVQIAFYERLLNEAENEEEQTTYQQELFELRQNYQAFLEELEQAHPEYYELKYELTYPSVSELQNELLDDKTALLEYFTGDSSLYLFVLTKEDFQIQKLEKNTDFENNLSQLRNSLRQVTTNGFTNFTSSSHFIYNNYLQNTLTQLSPKINQLLLIPDGQLSYIPFQSLIQYPVNQSTISDPRFDTLSYLVQDYAISYAYSSTLFLKNQTVKKQRDLAFGGFAPVFSGGKGIPERSSQKELSELPFSQIEVKKINALFGGQNYLQSDASLANFKNQAPNFNILHLSTHAAVEDENPNQSRIYFHDDYLTVNEIYNLPIQADLTVLSACETGVGEYKRGEGMLSLARAFMYAGCPSLVTSLWQVNDEKTASLMLTFYEQLLQKQPKNRALQQAQINYLETASMEAAHPFYWAAFVQVGDSEAIVGSRFGDFWWLVFGGIGLLFLGAYFNRKSKQKQTKKPLQN